MRVDFRVKHDVETRRHAAELFDSGVGCWGASHALSVPKCLAAGEMTLAPNCRSCMLKAMRARGLAIVIAQRTPALAYRGRSGRFLS